MAEPIKNKRLNDLANAPTPQNTPATATSSFAGRVQPSVATIKEEDAQGALANNPALLSMIQGKLGSLVGRPSGYIESLPKPVRERISGLKGIQVAHTKLEAQFQEELLALEKKYFAKYAPLYERRAEIIAGKIEPTEEEIETGKEAEEDNEDDEAEGAEENKDQDQDDQDEDIKGIPEFWLTALKNLVPVAETITDRDDEALSYLVDVRMRYLDKPGFALEFEFAENPFFTNKVLTKTYYYQEETGYGGDFIYDHAEGCEIEWKSAQTNLTVSIETRKQRNKHTGATRTIEKTIPVESFFEFFSPPVPPSGDDEGEEDDTPEDIEERLELDYQLGEEIKEKLIPRAVDWYTGEALEYEALDDYDEEEFGEEFDDEEDDEDEDDDDESSEEDDDEGKAKKPEPQECKQS